MEIFDRIDDMSDLIEGAKSMPLSQSCVVPRGEALDLLEDVRSAVPDSVREADVLLRRRDDILADASRETEAMVAGARVEAARARGEAADDAERARADAAREAERIIADARARAERLVANHEIVAEARQRAADLLADARRDCDDIRGRTDSYLEAKLGTTEEALGAALEEIRRGRTQVQRRLETPPMVTRSADPVDDFFDIEAAGGFTGTRSRSRR